MFLVVENISDEYNHDVNLSETFPFSSFKSKG